MEKELTCSPNPEWTEKFKKKIQEEYKLSLLDSVCITGLVEKIVREQLKEEWKRCSEEDYPYDEEGFVMIAYYDDMDENWYYWPFSSCPFGWNVLCRKMAYWRVVKSPWPVDDNGQNNNIENEI